MHFLFAVHSLGGCHRCYVLCTFECVMLSSTIFVFHVSDQIFCVARSFQNLLLTRSKAQVIIISVVKKNLCQIYFIGFLLVILLLF